MRRWLVVGTTISLVLVGYFVALLYAVDCSELPDADRSDACDRYGDSWTAPWWLAALWPAALFAAANLIPAVQQRTKLAVAVTAALMLVFWLPLFAMNP